MTTAWVAIASAFAASSVANYILLRKIYSLNNKIYRRQIAIRIQADRILSQDRSAWQQEQDQEGI